MDGTVLLLLSLLKCYSFTDAAFTYTPMETGFCDGTDANLTWIFDNAAAQSIVQWTVNDTISIARLLGGSTFIEETGYTGKLQNDRNGGLIIKSVTTGDSGKYKCIVSYNDGTPRATHEVDVTVYNTYNVPVKIEKTEENDDTILKPASPDSSITYTWSIEDQSATGDNFHVKKSGNYTLCISGGKANCLNNSLSSCTSLEVTLQGSATIELTTQLSTDKTSVSETSSKMSTELLSLSTQTTITLTDKSTVDETLPGSTESNGTKSETSTVLVTTSPSGLSEEMIIIISSVSAVGGILLTVIIVVVVCCKQRASTAESEKHRKKHGKLQYKNGNNRDLNSNYKQSEKVNHSASSRKKVERDNDLHQNHSKKNLYGESEYPRSQKYHQQNYFPRNQHHYRNQKSTYLPYTDPRNVMYYQRYPGSGYSEDTLGYSRGGPYRMQQFYPESHARQDRYTDDGLERRIGHRRGDYGSYWDNDTLY